MEKVKCLESEGVFHAFYNAEESQHLENLILMNQVHSADVLFIEKRLSEYPKVDALVTNVSGLKLAVKTADCAPVLLFDSKNKIIAAIHAGWKGAFQGVIENCILKMLEKGAEISSIKAAVGPHIQKESFEADDKMKALFPVTEYIFFEEKGNALYSFDFHAYVLYRLKRAGIMKIESVLIDTYQNEDYFSYRRDSKNPLRQFSVISLE